MFRIQGSEKPASSHARIPSAKGRRGRARLRPGVESLESRALLTFTVNPAISITAETSSPGPVVYSQESSTSNPSTVTASWQTSDQTVSTQGHATFGTSDSSLVLHEDAQATEQFTTLASGFINALAADTRSSISGTFTLTSPSVVTFSGNSTYVPNIGSVAGNVYFGTPSTSLELFYSFQPPVNGQIGQQFTLPAGDYYFNFLLSTLSQIYISAPNVIESGPTSASLDLALNVSPVKVATTTVLSPPAPSTYGQPVKLQATVAPSVSGAAPPSGTVTFMDGSTALGTGILNPSGTSGIATFTTLPSQLRAGDHPNITAVYNGDGNFSGSTSGAVDQQVNQATPTVSVTDAGGTYNGMPFPATALVAGVIPGVDATPSPRLEGVSPTLTYYAGSTASGTPLAGAPSAVGTYSVVAKFPGSTDYTSATSSTSAPTSFVITEPPPPILPQIVLNEATTKDAQSVTVNYTVADASVSKPLEFDVYRSDQHFLDKSQLLGKQTIDPSKDPQDLTVGRHTVKLLNGTSLPLDPLREYIFVVADANGSIQEAPGSVNTTYFRKYVLGVVSHGFELPIPLTSIPTWETGVARELKTDDFYDDAIAFDWVLTSGLPLPFLATRAGNSLYGQVVTRADQLAAAHPGDVVDLHFIGHSRGAVVVSQALQDLAGTTDPALQGSYIKLTLLDPHPANISTIPLQSTNPFRGSVALAVYEFFQFEDTDPQVIIPNNVKYTEIYYQHSNWYTFPILSPEFTLNLWGEGPNDGIINHSGSAINWYNLTNVYDHSNGPNGLPIGAIGHSEVPIWYEVHVVDAGLAFSLSSSLGGGAHAARTTASFGKEARAIDVALQIAPGPIVLRAGPLGSQINLAAFARRAVASGSFALLVGITLRERLRRIIRELKPDLLEKRLWEWPQATRMTH